MNYLIDGHNLIGKIDDIQLSDPDDEAKLVLRLVNWAAVGANRRVIVVFDGGTPGNNWAGFKSERVKAVFVPQGQTADAWLIRFMREQVQNVKEFHLVSSDRAILKQAENRRIVASTSEAFAAELAAERAHYSQLGQERVEAPKKPLLREHEVDAWLQLFGGEPEIKLRPYQPHRNAPAPEPGDAAPPAATPAEAATPASGHADDPYLTTDEVAAWLDLFGGEPNIVYVRHASSRAKRQVDRQTPTVRAVPRKRPPQTPPAKPDSPLSQDDIDLWHMLFGQSKED